MAEPVQLLATLEKSQKGCLRLLSFRAIHLWHYDIDCLYLYANTSIMAQVSMTVRMDSQLKKMFDEHPGMTKVFIHTMEGYNDITIECDGFIALNDRIIDYCEQIGQIAYKPI